MCLFKNKYTRAQPKNTRAVRFLTMLAVLVELVEHFTSLPNPTNNHISPCLVTTVLTTNNNVSSLLRHISVGAQTWRIARIRADAQFARARGLFSCVPP